MATIGAAVAALLIRSQVTYRMSYFCTNCASQRFTTEWPQDNVLSERIEKSEFTAWIESEYPGPCSHEWFTKSGSRGRRG